MSSCFNAFCEPNLSSSQQQSQFAYVMQVASVHICTCMFCNLHMVHDPSKMTGKIISSLFFIIPSIFIYPIPHSPFFPYSSIHYHSSSHIPAMVHLVSSSLDRNSLVIIYALWLLYSQEASYFNTAYITYVSNVAHHNIFCCT
jgi:hypothetical protein